MSMRSYFRSVAILLICLLSAGALYSFSLPDEAEYLFKSGAVIVEAAESKVTTANLNMRSGAGTGYSVILVIPKGATVSVSAYEGVWAKVTYNGKSGFAHDSYLKASGAATSYTAYTTANLNMRSGPGTSYGVLTVMPKGAEVNVLQASGAFYKVSYGGKTGYASASYLKTGAGTPSPAPAPAPSVDIYYTTDDLNLRTGPGTGYAVIVSMPRGSQVTMIDGNGTWPKVRYGTREGYASPKYLSKTLPSTSPSPQPPPSGAAAAVIRKGNKSTGGKPIALTFDDYGSAAQIRSILASLESYGAKATFFPNGDFVKNNPGLIREIAAKGHAVESHTYSHRDLSKLSDADVKSELRQSRNAIYSATGKYPTLVRPPYGAYDSRTGKLAGAEGYRYVVLWSVDTSDWATTRYGVTITTDYVIKTAVDNASPNGIILMHMHTSKAVNGLPSILQKLKAQGYTFVTVHEMVN